MIGPEYGDSYREAILMSLKGHDGRYNFFGKLRQHVTFRFFAFVRRHRAPFVWCFSPSFSRAWEVWFSVDRVWERLESVVGQPVALSEAGGGFDGWRHGGMLFLRTFMSKMAPPDGWHVSMCAFDAHFAPSVTGAPLSSQLWLIFSFIIL